MPDPKKKKNAPANAATDTNTDGPQKMYKKREATPRQGQMKREATPLVKSAVQGALAGGAAQMKRQATPRSPASGGSGGTVGTHGQPKMYKKRIPRQVAEDAVGGAVGGVLSNRRTATPRTETIGRAKATPIARTETIGTAKATPISQSNTTQPGHTNRPADPFLAGFNSDDYSVVRNRNRGGNRRQSR